MNKIKLCELKLNPKNPREITPEKFDALKRSIKDFPKMMELRPMVVDSNGIVLGGNMRLKALQELGYRQIPETWVKRADKLSKEEQRRFLAVDNLEFGTWTDEFANEFDLQELTEWGFDAKDLDIDFAEEVKESDQELTEETEELKHIDMVRILISIPIDKAVDCQKHLTAIKK